MALNKYFQGLVVAGGTMLFATTAFAHHGQEYVVSACDKDGANTANMVVTTVGHNSKQDNVHEILQSTFSELMSRHGTDAHLNITEEYVSDLVSSFNAATSDVMDAVGQNMIYLDFHHPRASHGGPVTPGCHLRLAGGK